MQTHLGALILASDLFQSINDVFKKFCPQNSGESFFHAEFCAPLFAFRCELARARSYHDALDLLGRQDIQNIHSSIRVSQMTIEQ